MAKNTKDTEAQITLANIKGWTNSEDASPFPQTLCWGADKNSNIKLGWNMSLIVYAKEGWKHLDTADAEPPGYWMPIEIPIFPFDVERNRKSEKNTN